MNTLTNKNSDCQGAHIVGHSPTCIKGVLGGLITCLLTYLYEGGVGRTVSREGFGGVKPLIVVFNVLFIDLDRVVNALQNGEHSEKKI